MERNRTIARTTLLVASLAAMAGTSILPGSTRLDIDQRQSVAGAREEIVISVREDAVVIEDRGAPATCCSVADGRLAVRGDRIEVRRADAGEACPCPAALDVTYTIRGLLPGETIVSFRDASGALLAEEAVTVSPAVVQVMVAPCGEASPDGGKAWIEVREGGLLLGRKAAVEDACLELGAAVEIRDRTVRISEEDRGAPCGCAAAFDLAVIVSGLAPGVWSFEHRDLRGKLLASGEARIPGPTLVVTRGPGTPARPETGAIRVEGSSVVVERRDAPVPPCLDLHGAASIEGDLLVIREIDRSPPCAGPEVPANLRVEARGIPDGRYRVAVETLGGGRIEGSAEILARFVRGITTETVRRSPSTTP